MLIPLTDLYLQVLLPGGVAREICRGGECYHSEDAQGRVGASEQGVHFAVVRVGNKR